MSIRKAAFVAMVWVAGSNVAPASGQSVSYIGDADEVDIQRAMELEAEAAELGTNRRNFDEAADLLREAATLRPVGDPVAVDNLTMAGRFAFYGDDLQSARTALLEGADAAIRIGDVLRAAYLLVDAAHVSARLKDGRTVISAFERARLLSTSPHLTSVERARILNRLNPLSEAVDGLTSESGQDD